MVHLPEIISDLAMILLVAGITTIIFKKYNQPLVLGYIVAGFITGPHFKLFPTITDTTNITTWSEIGVIFLLFALGLEFSFYKLKSVGPTAGIAALINMTALLTIGYACGQLLGWSTIESVFLGAMISLASTMIIIKAFEDLKLKGEYFTQVVFGILIIEDIVGIIMMVMVSTFATASADFSALTMVQSVLRLGFFLVLWFIMGMYLVPTFFKYTQKFMNEETMLISSVGLCLGMVVLGTSMGFSSALGAFMMGSLIAEAPNSEKIEHLFKPVKDLFGAIFFVSVGMLVDPQLLLEYAVPVICIFVANFCSKFIFATIGVIAAGKDLKTALLCSFSLMSLGEFSFILAALGVSLGLIGAHMYSIIVAVSVLTTVAAPGFIKLAGPVYTVLNRYMPAKIKSCLQQYAENDDEAKDVEWKQFLQTYFTRLIVFTTFLIAISAGAYYYLMPFLQQQFNLPYISGIAAFITLAVMAPFIRALLVNRSANPELFMILWLKNRANHISLTALIVFKVLVAGYFIYFVFAYLAQLPVIVSVIAAAVVMYVISSSEWLLREYLKMESRFLVNLNERHMQEYRRKLKEEGKDYTFGWFDEELFVIKYRIKEESVLSGRTLAGLSLRDKYGCNILQIRHGNDVVAMPGGNQKLLTDDKILLIGSTQQLDAVAAGEMKLGLETEGNRQTLKEFLLSQKDKKQEYLSCAITVKKDSVLLGKSMKNVDLRKRWNCLVIGLERGGYTKINPDVSLSFQQGDLLWVLGRQKMINELVREDLL